VWLLGSIAAFAAVDPARLAGTGESRWVFRVYYEKTEDIRALHPFDLWEYNNFDERYVLVMVRPAEYPDLAGLGFRLELDEARTDKINAPRVISPAQISGIPGYPCFRTVEEAYATAQQIALDHPDLAAWIDAGDSWEKQNGLGGHDVRALRLTNVTLPGPKPKLFVTGSMHAREYAPAELVTRFGELLVGGYDVDADVTWLLDHHEVHLMLMANPDGRKQAETGLSWRKNTNQNYCSPTSNSRGADLNRNAEFEWGCCGGASNSECNSLYRGPFPASEPETVNMQEYMRAEFPDQRADPLGSPAPDDATGIYVDVHAAGDLVLWPWGFPGGAAPNGTALQTLGRKLAYFNGFQPKQAIDFYPTDGTLLDFAYGDLGIASYVFELGNFYFEDCSYFENVIVPDNLPSLLYAAKIARTPYLTPAGPDALQVTATPAVVSAGEAIQLTATIDDTRFNNSNGFEPTQAIDDAEYYIDVPPWSAGSPTPIGMFAADGSFDEPVEPVTAIVSTTGLGHGRHTLFVRGRDADGNRGAVGAAFITVENEQGDDDGDGVANGIDCDPEDGNLWAVPSPARDLAVTKAATDNLTWLPPVEPGATVVGYHVLRSPAASDFGTAVCTLTGTFTATTDEDVPGGGGLYHYLIRALNRCGENLGSDSAGSPRSGADCAP
jgi:hypothetical protein